MADKKKARGEPVVLPATPPLWDVLAEVTGMERSEAKFLAYTLMWGKEQRCNHEAFWHTFCDLLETDPELLAPFFEPRKRS